MRVRYRQAFPPESWHRVGDFVLPGRYEAWVEDPDGELPYDIEFDVVVEGGRARCDALRCRRRPGGPEVTSDGIRQIKVGRLVKESALAVAMLVEDWNGGDFHVDMDAQDFTPEDFYAAYRRTGPRRRTALTDEELAKAAEVYRIARSQRQPTREVLADVFNISESSAGRWVVQMRRRGLLGPAPGDRRGGEAEPVSAKRPGRTSKTTKKGR